MTDQPFSLTPDNSPEAPAAHPEQELAGEANRLAVPIDFILYGVFVLVGLVLRLAELNTIVLGDTEAHEALAVLRVIDPRVPGSILTARQPLMFTANALAMVIGGANNAVVRFPTVLIGLLLILMPILFRRWIGRTAALIISGMLTLSPVLLTASRSTSGSVWTLALALGALWLAGRFMETRRASYAVAASVGFVLAVFMAEAAGFLVVIMIGVGLAFALATADDPDQRVVERLRETLAAWPWIRSLIASGIALGLIGTVFLLYLPGLGAVGDLVGHALQGFVFRPAQNPIAFPLLTSLLYEPVFWLFGLIGAGIVLSEDGDFLRRGLVGWLIAGVVACLIYPGAGPEHALWLTIPLAALSAITIERVLSPVQDRFWNVPIWGPWLHAVGVVATLSITGINLLILSRAALTLTPALIPSFDQPFRLVLTVLTLALVVILFFLVGSVWGARAAWHGMGIGLLIFLGAYSLSSGWRAAVLNASDPREFWRPHPASQNLTFLEGALVNTSLRAAGMPNNVALSVDWPDDGALAWAIRRFEKVTYVDQLSQALNGPAILGPRSLDKPKNEDKPPLGAAYVGEDFAVYSTWDRATMQYWDVLAWLYGRESRVPPNANERIVLWVRSDVYGVPNDSLDTLGAPAPTK